MAKIAFISPIPLFPAEGGNRVRLLNLLRAARDLGHEVHFILMPSRQLGAFDEAAHRAFFPGGRFRLLSRPSLGEAFYLLRRSAYAARRRLTRSPLRLSDVDETYFNGFTAQIRRLDAATGFDVAVVLYVAFSRALEAFGDKTRRLLDTQDSFAGQMPAAEEARGLARADAVIAIQEHEAALFRQLLASVASPAAVITVGHFIDTRDALQTELCEGAAFIGSDFRQNNVSLGWFIEEVLPLIRREAPSFRLNVAGSVGRAVPDADGVVKLGRVAHFMDAFARTPILVNAITMGTGQKIKLLEAFGCGLPAVSTELGVDGLPAPDRAGVQVVPNGDAAAFAAATLELYHSAARRRELGEASHAIARRWNAQQRAALDSCLRPESPATCL